MTVAEPAPPIAVVIVDDHQMVRDGLRLWLDGETDIAVVGVAGSIAEALEVIDTHHPQVVLMDFHLPDGDGATATSRILELHPQTSVVMISVSVNDDLLSRAIEAGCSGFMAKERGSDEVVSAVRAAAKGEMMLPKEVLQALMGRMRNPAPTSEMDLTNRELEVLRLLAQGLSTSAVCERLFISEHTARNHTRNILLKLGVHSKLEAVALATRQGLLNMSDFEGAPPTSMR